MSISGVLSTFSRLSLSSPIVARQITTNATSPLYFRATPCLSGEPLKKRKKMDPAVVRARFERKQRKLEKAIRRLLKNVKQPKPVEEFEISVKLIKEEKSRTRKLPPLTQEVVSQRSLLIKDWTRYKTAQYQRDFQALRCFMSSQLEALDELRASSEELYQAAVVLDEALLTYSATGPTETPPIKDFDSPDGEYIDVTKKFEGEE